MRETFPLAAVLIVVFRADDDREYFRRSFFLKIIATANDLNKEHDLVYSGILIVFMKYADVGLHPWSSH